MHKLISNGAFRATLGLGAVGVLALGVLVSPMLSGSPRSTRAADNDTSNDHVISVTGSGKVTVKPDVADVSLGVQVQRDTAKQARDDAAKAMAGVIAALKSLAIDDADIQTSMLDISPTYDYNSSYPPITGYQTTNVVSVHVRDINKVADVIDNSVAAGATTVNGVSFDVSNRADVENQARDAAVKDARSHADALASAAGVTISGVRSISETTISYPFPYYAAADGVAKGIPAPAAPTPVQPGTQDVTIMVTVEYLI